MPFVKNAWYVACWADDVKPNEMFARQLLGEQVVFYRNAAKEVVALQDRCPHRFIPLHRGKLVDDKIECAYHGLQFDCTGKCVKNPHGDGKIPAAARVKRYPVVEKHRMIWIWMGEESATEDTIPDYSVMDNTEGFQTSFGYLEIPANYLLMGENLLDLSHITYLHDGYLGSPEQVGADQVVEEVGNEIHCKRWMPNVSIPGIFDLLYRQDGKPVDMWTNMRWLPPSCFLLDTGAHEVGGQREDYGWYYGIHILTPETEKTTHYHFAAAMPPGTDLPAEVDEKFRKLRRYAFEMQDQPIIDAQQKAMGDTEFWDMKPVLLGIDAGPVRMRRTIQKMLQDEAERVQAQKGQRTTKPETAVQ
ncbi:aromatic ring-hydroxylating dioxygenase subunit alpha [Pusillimonas sp. DMV24BSW_D]|uniref:aromatic ring-hydroxylating dioxygenase subunit alpha n=1 Tax=Neopusillimonas aestuarii TaxID=2716226 RepID=UPI00140A3C81|nr:aromatic ring-hydroxylating dioxygenase subunit alpha [Pusillimonas sp. DMV24BSW_D]QIM48621.1 aromatic ring-hydroxylating dioxygenase subunit alpha [Pusillimonas sp. DMV24BSW_D]